MNIKEIINEYLDWVFKSKNNDLPSFASFIIWATSVYKEKQ